jgi:hypothetical protein
MPTELLIVMVLLAADATKPVRDITHQEPEFGSIAEPLHIVQKSGLIELSADVSKAKIEIEHYREGKKLPVSYESLGVSPGKGANDGDRIRFAVSCVDTDFLPLGDSKKEHCRLLLKLMVGGVAGTTTHDVPKKECDFSQMTNGGGFGPKASSRERIPLLWMIDGRTASVIGGTSPEDVVKRNPKGDLVIVFVRLYE